VTVTARCAREKERSKCPQILMTESMEDTCQCASEDLIPVPAECAYECARNSVYGVPVLENVRARVHLSVLGATEDGDVFYLAGDPLRMLERENDGGPYNFRRFGDEIWSRLEDIGTGDPKQRVVVLHNTQKYCTDRTGEC
jgi:hypothetical protein